MRDAHEPPWRLFTALWPPEPVRHQLLGLREQWRWPAAARLTAPERLHLTLHFLGAVPAARVGELRLQLGVPFESHVLDLDAGRQQVWPGGVAVLELEAPPPLQRLHQRLAGAIERLALPVEARRWRPHLTFARKADGALPPPHATGAGRWPADAGYALVRSIPGRGYVTLHSWPA